MATLARPAQRLDELTPIVGSEADIETAFVELSWLDYKRRTVETLENAEIDAVRRRNAKHYFVAPPTEETPEPLTLRQRYDQLVAAVVKFATTAKDALLAPCKKGAKTRQFNLGTLGYRSQPEKLKSRFEEATLDDLLTVLLDRHDIRGKMQSWMTEFTCCGLPLGEMVRVSYEWNSRRICELVELKKISPEQLAEIGLTVERDPEKVEVKLR